MGCGSSTLRRKTNGSRQADDADQADALTAMPTRATDQKSATISEIQRSHSCQASIAAPGATLQALQYRPQRIRRGRADPLPGGPTSCTSDDAMPVPTMRSRGTRMMATGFCPPPGRRVRARRIAAPISRSR